MPQTPGVYIDELSAFPNSVVQVATAIPAFIGYTPQATYQGKSYLFKPVKITSMSEFETFFAYPKKPGTEETPQTDRPFLLPPVAKETAGKRTELPVQWPDLYHRTRPRDHLLSLQQRPAVFSEWRQYGLHRLHRPLRAAEPAGGLARAR